MGTPTHFSSGIITPFVSGSSGGSVPGFPGFGGATSGNATLGQPPAGSQIFFVNSANALAADGGPSGGTSPARPFKTINFAVTRCLANNGDVIYVGPGHVESVIAAGGLTIGKAGVTIIFQGVDSERGSIVFGTSTAATMLVTAANVQLVNPRFNGNIDALVNAIVVSAANFRIYNAKWVESAAVGTLIQIRTTAAGAGLKIFGYEQIDPSSLGTQKTEAIRIVGGAGHIFQGLNIQGNYSTAIINNITTLASGVEMDNCDLINVGSGTAMTWLSSSTPGAVRLSLFVPSVTAAGFTFDSATLIGASGTVGNSAAIGEIAVQGAPKTLPASTTQTIFTVTGPVLITEIIGVCTTVVQSQATTFKFSVKVGALTAVDVCATRDLNAFPAGGVISPITSFATALVVASPNTLGVMDQTSAKSTAVLMGGSGIVTCTTVATSTGAFQYSLRYKPLSPTSIVVAA